MNNRRQITIDTYNQSAQGLSEYFQGMGPRVDDIDKAIDLAGNPSNPKVLEIGCGDGRDAKEILKRTNDYVGFDISEGLIKLAQQRVPGGHFEVADAVSYQYPEEELDVVFAFASLLHLDRKEVKGVLQKVHNALKPGGVFFNSLKLAEKYTEIIQEDEFGTRAFYLYNPELLHELAGNGYEVAYISGGFKTRGNTKWFEIALRKI